MAAEIVIRRERSRRSCRKCLDAGRKNLLLFGAETAKLPLPFTGPNGSFEIRPQSVAARC